MNIQQIQERLNYLILVITAFSTIIMLVDFLVGLVHLWHQVALNVESCTAHKTSEQSNIEPIDTTNSNLNIEQENYHPSAHYNYTSNSSLNVENDNGNQSNDSTSGQPELELNNSVTLNIDKIDLRTARKIASAIKKVSKPKSDLIIKQTVNGKSVPLAWLQAQIKNRLEIAPEIVKPIIQELAPTAIHNSQQDIQHHQVVQTTKHQR
ncbi:hypothetical protein ACSQ6I_27870 [Anabaena sp. WFMT]|uniref:hypothetical protein n=1 Tax=Anabaena sp. WFMT TaxID=3449730 RepID=UPI003F22D6DE